METINIQTKIGKLYNIAHALRHIGDASGFVRLNKEIHDQIDEYRLLTGRIFIYKYCKQIHLRVL